MKITLPLRRQFYLANASLVLLVAGTAAFDMATAGTMAGIIATSWLAMLLIIPRLLHIPVLRRWHADMLAIAKISRHSGLWTAAWFAVHVALYIPSLPSARLLQYVVLTVLMFLAALSNSWSYAHIKLWKHYNMLAWALPLPLLAYTLNKGMAQPVLFTIWSDVLLLLTVASALLPVFAGARTYFDRLRLYMLAGGGVVTLLVFWLADVAY